MKHRIQTVFLLFLSLLFLFGCKTKEEYEIETYLYSDDYLSLAIVCSKHRQVKKYKEKCDTAIGKAESEILELTSLQARQPYSKIFVDEEKKQKLETLLQKNIHLDIKYRQIWKQTIN
jgi:hypothetical protein